LIPAGRLHDLGAVGCTVILGHEAFSGHQILNPIARGTLDQTKFLNIGDVAGHLPQTRSVLIAAAFDLKTFGAVLILKAEAQKIGLQFVDGFFAFLFISLELFLGRRNAIVRIFDLGFQSADIRGLAFGNFVTIAAAAKGCKDQKGLSR
jgi:hypothetical protein